MIGHLVCSGPDTCHYCKEIEMTLGRSAGEKTCDDCTETYAGPAYYTFQEDACRTSDHDGPATPHLGCTGNLCPRCAGPDLEPDRADDPRRPAPEIRLGGTRDDPDWGGYLQ